ncbi:MAG: MFS transporter [Candidatus Thorarchaeota archaeon]|jgi:MFS family permease
MTSIARVFGLVQPTDKATRIVRILALIIPAYTLAFNISLSFWMIYIAESLGGGDFIAGLTLVGVLVVIQLLIQTLLDYPTGALGDHIGQRWVIASAMICFAFTFWLTSIATPDSPFIIFVAIYVLFGIANSQESGSWFSWFDNNYRVAMPHDEDRKQYGVLRGRMWMLMEIVSTLIVIPGAWLALIFARTWVFQIQAIIFVVFAILILRFVRDFPEVEEARKEHKSRAGYRTILIESFQFLVSDRFVLLSTLGAAIFSASGVLYFQLLAFPLYYTYLVTEVAVASFITIWFLTSIVAQERSGVWSRRFDPVKWIPRFRLLNFFGFVEFIFLAAFFHFFPSPINPSNTVQLLIPFTDLIIIEMPAESIIPIVLLLVLFAFTNFTTYFANILTQRLMIDVIPNKIRNSLYSLQPTLVMIIAIPLVLAFGWILPAFGFSVTFMLLSLIGLLGYLILKRGFSYPIQKAADLEVIQDSPESVTTIQEAADPLEDLEASGPFESDEGQ